MTRARTPARRRSGPSIGGPLYERTNGFLLGCFPALLCLRFARDRFVSHRERMGQLLDEIGLTVSPARMGR